MLSMRAKCFSCDSHPEIGCRADRRREHQVLSVHVDHQRKVYFSYCPPVRQQAALINVLAWRLCTRFQSLVLMSNASIEKCNSAFKQIMKNSFFKVCQ